MEYRAVSVIQVQKIQDDIASRYELEIPTYKVAIAGGGEQTFEYDADSITDTTVSDEDKNAWKTYQANLNEMRIEANEKVSAYVYCVGIECEISDEWRAMQSWLGIELPTNEFDLKVRYITTELLKTPFDMKEAMAEIMKLSLQGVDSKAVAAAEKSFQSTL